MSETSIYDHRPTVVAAERLTANPLPLVSRPGCFYADAALQQVHNALLRESHGTSIVGVGGCRRKNGATTTALNLAQRAADHAIPTLLIDANVRQPSISKTFRAVGPGLADCLAGESSVEDCASPTKTADLLVMGIGQRKFLKGGLRLQQLPMVLRETRESFQLVVIDLPRLDELENAEAFVPHVDGLLLAARYGLSRRRLVRAESQINRYCGNLLGVVMIDEPRRTDRWWHRFF